MWSGVIAQTLFQTAAVVAMPFVTQRAVSSRETVVKHLLASDAPSSDDDASWTELRSREVAFDDIKVCVSVNRASTVGEPVPER